MAKQTETVEILITAEDRATAKFQAARKELEGNVKAVKDVGSQAKASTELVGTLANQMGGGWIGQSAGQFAQLTERISAFSEVQKLGTAGQLAFAAGMAGTVFVIASQLVPAIHKAISGYDELIERQRRSAENARNVSATKLRELQREFAFEKERLSLMTDKEDQELRQQELLSDTTFRMRSSAAEVARLTQAIKAVEQQDAGGLLYDEVKNNQLEKLREELQLEEQKFSLLEGQTHELEMMWGERGKELEMMRQQKQAQEEAAKSQERVRQSLAKLAAEEAAEQKKAAEEQAKEKERLSKITDDYVEKLKLEAIELERGKEAAESYRLQQQGLDKATADQLASLNAELDRLRQPETADEAVTASQPVQAFESRLLSGRGSGVTQDHAKNTADATKKTAERAAEISSVISRMESVLQGIENNTSNQFVGV